MLLSRLIKKKVFISNLKEYNVNFNIINCATDCPVIVFLGFDKAPIDEALFSFMEYGIHNHEDTKFGRQIRGSLRTTIARNFITKIINNESEMPGL